MGHPAPSQANLTLSKSFHPFHGVNSIEMKSLLRGLIAGKQSQNEKILDIYKNEDMRMYLVVV